VTLIATGGVWWQRKQTAELMCINYREIHLEQDRKCLHSVVGQQRNVGSVALHIKYLLLLLELSLQIPVKMSNIKRHEFPSGGSRILEDGR
jgi:hypothetical protein